MAFRVSKVTSFSHHKIWREINTLRQNDWAHVHVTDRTLSFGDRTYNLNSGLSYKISIPQYSFG